MKKLFIFILFLFIAALAIGGFVFRNEAAQDAIVRAAVQNNIDSATATSFGESALEVIFCGTASPMGAGRAQSCVAVLAGDKFFIVDSGARSASVAQGLGLPLGRLDGVLLTHYHSDHIAALGELHLASWVRGRPYKLPVYGARGISQIVDGFNLAYGQDYTYRTDHHGEAIMPSANAGLRAERIRVSPQGLDEFYNQGGLKISAFRVTHDPIEPAIGYRFDYKGRSVVITGDTKRDPNVAVAAQNVDLLVHEVLHPDLVKITAEIFTQNGNKNIGQLLLDTLDYHTYPHEAEEIADSAGAKRLVFYHYAPVPQNGLIERMFLRGIKDPSKVILADDGMHLRLPLDSTAIEIVE